MCSTVGVGMPPRVGLVAGLEAAHAAVDALVGAPELTGHVWTAAECALAVRSVERLARRLEALRLRLVSTAARSDVAAQAGHASTGAWLASTTHTTGRDAAGLVRLADALDTDLAATGEALAAGDVSVEHAQVIATTTSRLPETVTAAERDQVEAGLVAAATRVDPDRLRRASRTALAFAERNAAQVAEHEARLVQDEEQRARTLARLTIRDNQDGTSSGWFMVPTLAASILAKAVQQLTSPRRTNPAKTHGTFGATSGQETLTGQDAANGQADGQDCAGQWGTADERESAADAGGQATDWAHAYGLASTDLLEHLPTDRLTRKAAATIVVTTDLDALRTELGVARVDTGQTITAGDVRRLACTAGIVPAVLDGESLPLDLGRARRFFTEAHHTALATRCTECAATGCDRPYAWCDLHHEHPWSSGGPTNIDMAVPLCGFHHHRIHDPTYTHQINTNQHGIKTVHLQQKHPPQSGPRRPDTRQPDAGDPIQDGLTRDRSPTHDSQAREDQTRDGRTRDAPMRGSPTRDDEAHGTGTGDDQRPHYQQVLHKEVDWDEPTDLDALKGGESRGGTESLETSLQIAFWGSGAEEPSRVATHEGGAGRTRQASTYRSAIAGRAIGAVAAAR